MQGSQGTLKVSIERSSQSRADALKEISFAPSGSSQRQVGWPKPNWGGTRKECLESLATVPLLIADDFGMRKLSLTAVAKTPTNNSFFCSLLFERLV
jgi:hypothetical protein